MNTPDPTAVPLDRDAVHRLVEEVLRRIRGAAPATEPVGLAASPVAVPGLAAGPVAAPAAGVSLADRVITLAHVEKLSAGVRVAIAPQAVITPSARDRAREAGIEFVRGAGVAAAPRPFLVAQAACGSHAAARAAAVARAVPAAQQLPASGLADVIAALERLCAGFAGAGTTTVPGELLASAPAACACKTHPH